MSTELQVYVWCHSPCLCQVVHKRRSYIAQRQGGNNLCSQIEWFRTGASLQLSTCIEVRPLQGPWKQLRKVCTPSVCGLVVAGGDEFHHVQATSTNSKPDYVRRIPVAQFGKMGQMGQSCSGLSQSRMVGRRIYRCQYGLVPCINVNDRWGW